MHDQFIHDSSTTRTNGANSPIVRGDNNTTTVVVNQPVDMNSTPVEFRKGRRSWINSRSAQLVAWLSTVIGTAIGIVTALLPGPIWQVDIHTVQSFSAAVGSMLPRAALVIALAVVVTLIWRSALRRRRALPKIGRRRSPFRSLIPTDRTGREYQRVTVWARCPMCESNNRDEWGAIATRGRGARRRIGFRCRLGHFTPFRADSLFTG